MKQYQFWFIVGSQFLYGPEVLETVAQRAAEMHRRFRRSCPIPWSIRSPQRPTRKLPPLCGRPIMMRPVPESLLVPYLFSQQNVDQRPALPAKPYCHLATQYHRAHSNEAIDMDFMNLNQAAHGDREHGFLAAGCACRRRSLRAIGWMRRCRRGLAAG